MNTNSTEIKTAKQPSLSCQANPSTLPTGAVDEIVNEIINPNTEQGGTGDQGGIPTPSRVAAGNLPGAGPGSLDAVSQSQALGPVPEAPQPVSPLKVSQSESLILSDLPSPSPSLKVSDLAPVSAPSDPPALAPAPPAEAAPSFPTLDLRLGSSDSVGEQSKIANLNSKMEEPAPPIPVANPFAEPAPVDPQTDEPESSHPKMEEPEVDPGEEPPPEESEFEAPNSDPRIPQSGFQPTLPANRHMGDKAKRRRTGKVANLPDELIEWINQQLFAEVRFGYILETLELRGAPHISQQNLTTWKAGGYRDWLDEQQARHEKQDRLEAVCALVASAGGRLDEAALMLISSQLLDTFAAYDNGLLKTEINKDPQSYHKLIQTLTKLYKVKQTFKKSNKTNLVNKPFDPGNPESVLPEAERGLTEETLKKITDAIRLY